MLLCLHVSAAGIAVHLNIASRLKYHLPFDVSSYQAEYNAGSFHPDAFYNCFGQSLAAENAHWPPFLKEAIDYYKEEYTLNGRQNLELKAFIYGVFTHQVADVSWHSLQSYQGLLKFISEAEFDGDITNAHNFIDTAGDFIILSKELENLPENIRRELLNAHQQKWKYPVEDIVKIHHRMGFFGIDASNLKFCMDRGHSALQGEVALVLSERTFKKRLSINLKESPLMEAVMASYYYGGLDEIVSTLQLCIRELDRWFMGEEIQDSWTICQPVFKKHPIETSEIELTTHDHSILEVTRQSDEDPIYISSGVPNSRFGTSIQTGDFLGEQTLVISAPYEDNVGSVYMMTLRDIMRGTRTYNTKEANHVPSLILKTRVNHDLHQFPGRFGHRLFRWMLNGIELLIVAEPGASSFRIYSGGNLLAILRSSQTSSILGSAGRKQWTILNSGLDDLNGDGFPELVIGSMTSDGPTLKPQAGIVISIDGKKLYDRMQPLLRLGMIEDVLQIGIESVLGHVFQVPDQLKQKRHYENFGSSFAMNNDHIFIGMNSIGAVVVFDKATKSFVGCLQHDRFIPANQSYKIKRSTSRETSLYAFGELVTGVTDSIPWLLVSAPGYSYGGKCPSCGMAYLYVWKDGAFSLYTKVGPETNIAEENILHYNLFNSMFGFTVHKLSDDLVTFSASGFNDSQGALFVMSLREVLKQPPGQRTTASILVTGSEGLGLTNFGHSVSEPFLYENDVYIAVGLPSYFFPDNDTHLRQSGTVAIMKVFTHIQSHIRNKYVES